MDLEGIMLGEISQTEKDKYHTETTTDKKKNRWLIARGEGKEWVK